MTFDPGDLDQATGILNLEIDGVFYDVAFTVNQTTAADIYGAYPGTFDFVTNASAAAAVDAVNFALDSAGALQVGAEGSTGLNGFRIGYEADVILGIHAVRFWDSAFVASSWTIAFQPDADSWNLGGRMWAVFTVDPTCPADTDDNGDVDVEDLLDLLAAWGPCAAPCPTDIDVNGVVDVEDLLDLLAAWGAC